MTALARAIGIRLGLAIGLLLAVVVVVFFLIQLAPGDAALYLGIQQGVGDPEYLAGLRADYGLDRPLLVQLGSYVGQVAQLDLGQSTYFERPVLDLILDRLFATVLLAGTSLFFAVMVGVAIGVFTARRPESPTSHGVTVLSLLGFATPVFWSALMFIVIFAAGHPFSILPVGGIEDVRYNGNWLGETVDLFEHLVLPALSLGIIYLAIIPVVTTVGLQVGALFSGALLVEFVFGWPGIGRLAVNSILRRDSPMLLGIMIFGSAMTIVANLLTDLAYRLIDPRIRVGGSR